MVLLGDVGAFVLVVRFLGGGVFLVVVLVVVVGTGVVVGFLLITNSAKRKSTMLNIANFLSMVGQNSASKGKFQPFCIFGHRTLTKIVFLKTLHDIAAYKHTDIHLFRSAFVWCLK